MLDERLTRTLKFSRISHDLLRKCPTREPIACQRREHDLRWVLVTGEEYVSRETAHLLISQGIGQLGSVWDKHGTKLYAKEGNKMAYSFTNSKNKTYYLHKKDTTLKNGRQQTIYFFAKEIKDGSLDSVPSGYVVSESRNGLPVLKKG